MQIDKFKHLGVSCIQMIILLEDLTYFRLSDQGNSIK